LQANVNAIQFVNRNDPPLTSSIISAGGWKMNFASALSRARESVMASFERAEARDRSFARGTALEVSIYRKRERGFSLRYILIPREILGVPM